MNSKISFKPSLALVMTGAAVIFAGTSVQAQTALIETAKQSCTDAAKAKGFELQNVLSSETTADGGAKVVLNLIRNGASAKLTCNLSKEGEVLLGNSGTTEMATSSPTQAPVVTGTVIAETAAAETTPGSFSWWSLLPLLGVPLFLLLAKGWPESGYPNHWGKKAIGGVKIDRNAEVIVRHSGHNGIDAHSGPGLNYPATRHFNDGNRETLTGRQNDGWVEMTDGEWLPLEYLDLEPNLV
jgi:hypothetical protein